MATIRRFEDLKVWQKARELVKKIYNVTSVGTFAKDYDLRSQIKRAGVSIMLNIAEGFARRTNKEFAQFLVNAHGSAAEIQSALYIALDQNYFNETAFNGLYNDTDEISKMLVAFSQYLRRSARKTP